MNKVSIVPCPDYSDAAVTSALDAVLAPLGGLDWVKPEMTVAIKANLVTFMKPEKAATTHPSLLCALTRRLVERGARVIVGDSPGGLYNAAFVGKVYSVCGLRAIEECGGELNHDFGQKDADFPDAHAAKHFTYTSYLDSADAVINFCKLKSHGMMGLSCAVKNMFGVVPGTMKPEYHYLFPDHAVFADMIVDLNEYFRFKVVLNICDAIVGMEGNGPTAGDPRHIGALIASRSPYHLDLVAADIIGMKKDNVPTLEAAYERGLAPATAQEVDIIGDAAALYVEDYKKLLTHSSLEFKNFIGGAAGPLLGTIASKLLRTRPKVKTKECIGCGVCYNICPAKAIVIKNKIAIIDKKSCIRCFCCQEFCPKGAMKVHRTAIARLLVKDSKK